MKKTLTKLILLWCICYFTNSHAQNYIGFSADNYSGVHGVIFNPSSIVDSRFRTDINLISGSAFLGSDYFSLDLNSALKATDGFNLDGNFSENVQEDNQFFLNLDVLGPSVMFNINKKNSIALTTRLRTFFNLNNINGEFYQNITNNFDQDENFDFQLNNLSGTMHVWGEFGLTYGRVLMERERDFLKGGLTLKYLQGAGSLFANSPSMTGSYDAVAQSLTTTGSLSYGTTPGFENEDVEFSNLSSGIGVDLGLTYEYRPKLFGDTISKKINKYKFKLGVSITDLGSISYDGSSVTTYDLNNTIDTEEFENKDTETVLDENYQGEEDIITTKINLPTALHILADYQIRQRLYLSVQGSLSLVTADKEFTNRIINTIVASPRLETRWLSIYLPVSLRQYDGLSMGAGLRFGPLMVGSGSVISNVIGDSSKTTDIYAGLKIPIYQ